LASLCRGNLFRLLIFVVLLELIVAPLGGDPHDMNYWVATGWLLISEGENPYLNLSFCDYTYPPFWAGVIASYYALASLLVGPHNPWLGPTDLLFYFFLKLPLIISSTAISLVIYGIVRRVSDDEVSPSLASSLWLLNPYVIWNVGVAGMFDVIPTLFCLLALWFLLRDEEALSALMLGLGVSSKIYPLLLTPVVILYLWRKGRDLRSIFRYLALFSLFPILLSLPFLLMDARSYIYANTSYYSEHFPRPTGLTVFLGLWVWGLDSYLITLLSQLLFGSMVVLFFICMGSWNNLDDIPLYGSLSILLAFFAFNRVVNEQYLIWALPLVILDVSTSGSRRRILYHALSILFLVHLFSNIFFFKFFHEFLKHFASTEFRSWVIFWMNRWSHRDSLVQVRLFIRSILGLLSLLICGVYAYLINRERCVFLS